MHALHDPDRCRPRPDADRGARPAGRGCGDLRVLLGGFGLGAMLGALSSAALRHRFTSDTLLRLLSALACVAVIGIARAAGGGHHARARARRIRVDPRIRELQHRRAALLAPLGDRPDAGDLSDCRVREHGTGKLVVGRVRKHGGLREH